MLASAASMAAGFVVWMLCLLLRRLLPALAAQRTGWLLAQVTVVAAFVVALIPPPQHARLLPPVDLEAVDAAMARYIEPAGQLALKTAPAITSAGDTEAGASWMTVAALAWFAVYALGLAWHALRWRRAQRLVDALAAAGRHVADCGSAVPVIEVDAPVSPMLLGPHRPRLLIPRHLRAFDPLQQHLIVEHELTHWRRHDLHWMLAGVVLQTLLWFNPFMRWLRASLLWAQELGCDRDVLRGRPAAERKAYAAALLAQLKLQCVPGGMALAFGGVHAETVKARIAQIRTPSASGRAARFAAAGMLAMAALASYALQPALAWHSGAALHCLALSDAATGQALLRQGQCNTRVTPASTFNIAVSLMGYDSGILKDEQTPRLPYHDSYAAWNPDWRTSTDPTEWIHKSVVWYAQQVTAQIGAAGFQRYVDGFGYGNRDVSGDPGQHNGLTMSWIGSSLQISPEEQVAFLRRIVNRELGLAPHAYDMTSRLLRVRTLANGWTVYGKTGTGSPPGPDGKDDRSRAYGWFVGWAVKGNRTIVFAHFNQDREEHEEAAGPRAREALLRELPARLDAL
nr:class D beta-lactamase [Pseudoduganella ginsengisoli]